ncbi:winged-helix domain-containing protein [Natrinema salaciae]|uniref:Ribonuclease R winged-helix domain-containing protein n=1 Tax=Natrinema salaciae TaxID=1186196 RepID=A0A1H9LIJ5_9EURY|nr:winged-helix domain-containing protein [Natrinema salaciae]SER11198.1 Ribonuclease R winged-helix domain-containing protein [Natrinema salaciae]
MSKNDDTILEFLAETGAAFSKRGLEVNFERRDIEVSYSTIKRRIQRLEAAGLTECVEDSGGYYEITDFGERYLHGDLDDDELAELKGRSP